MTERIHIIYYKMYIYIYIYEIGPWALVFGPHPSPEAALGRAVSCIYTARCLGHESCEWGGNKKKKKNSKSEGKKITRKLLYIVGKKMPREK